MYLFNTTRITFILEKGVYMSIKNFFFYIMKVAARIVHYETCYYAFDP